MLIMSPHLVIMEQILSTITTFSKLIGSRLYPDFTVSKWDDGQRGNYWSNYKGVDHNQDGIGDTPHIIDVNNQDNYPLTNPVNTDTEIQPQLPICNQLTNPYAQNTQEESSQIMLIAIIVIVTISVASLILNKILSNNKNNKA